MAHFHQWRRTRIQIQIPNPIITLYYAQLFLLAWIQIWIPVWIVSQMITVLILGTDLHPRDPNPNPSPLVEMSHNTHPTGVPTCCVLQVLPAATRCRQVVQLESRRVAAQDLVHSASRVLVQLLRRSQSPAT